MRDESRTASRAPADPARRPGPRWRAGIRDVLPALLLTAISLLTLPVIGHAQRGWGPGSGGPPTSGGLTEGTVAPDALAAVLVIVAALALVLRRLRPVNALVISTLATATYLVIGYPYGPVLLAVAIAVHAVARRRPPRIAALWAAATAAAMILPLLIPGGNDHGLTGIVPAAAWVALPFSIGLARQLAVEARSRARADADERLVQAERLRIAREVHDVVGHGLAAIQMQADVALHVRGTRPGQPEEALRAISAASAEALEELRSTLTAIRPEDAASAGGDRAATPGIGRLEALCDRVRAAGVTVDLEVRGASTLLPPTVDLAVYRIVQESLTNVVKHSAHPRAEVSVVRDEAGVEVRVSNQDLHPEGHAAGFGITGMQRRAVQLGGTLTFGPGSQPHLFTVRAAIPSPAPTAVASSSVASADPPSAPLPPSAPPSPSAPPPPPPSPEELP